MEDKTETQVVEQNAVTESVAAETPKRKTRTKKAAEKTVKPIVPKDIDPEQYVTVRNGWYMLANILEKDSYGISLVPNRKWNFVN